jgi:hypothetical protein
VLIVQSVVSLISAAQRLPARLVGPMPEMTGAGSAAKVEHGQ